jgi:thiol-disulfide isomerase/thioredoxin
MKNLLTLAIAAGMLGAAVSGSTAANVPPYSAPEFVGLNNWLNSPPLTVGQLRGKPVLIDFWTYDCINCLRTLPYVKSWHQKYQDKGLVVIGVHTPEYGFERKLSNFKGAVQRNDIRYPVVQDNGYGTWSAFGNQYWPALYLIDRKGRIVYTHFGEGNYAETEAAIKKVLAE